MTELKGQGKRCHATCDLCGKDIVISGRQLGLFFPVGGVWGEHLGQIRILELRSPHPILMVAKKGAV